MALFDYDQSVRLAVLDPTFDALIMAAYRKADSDNRMRLEEQFPALTTEFRQRSAAPAGMLASERHGENTLCPSCGGLNGSHGLVHRRHPTGGGGANVR